MRYLKPISLQELNALWGFEVPLIPRHRGQQLYLVVDENGTPTTENGGEYVAERDIRYADVVLGESEHDRAWRTADVDVPDIDENDKLMLNS